MKTLFAALALTAVSQFAVAAEMHTIKLEVSDMTCAACPLTVKAALKKQAGVSEINVNLKTKTAEVTYDPGKNAPAKLAQAVTDAGFPAKVKK